MHERWEYKLLIERGLTRRLKDAEGVDYGRFSQELLTTYGDRPNDIRLKELDEIVNPTWSPDGNRIAFTGLVGGVTDLFIYDLPASQLRRVTNDAFAESSGIRPHIIRRVIFTV